MNSKSSLQKTAASRPLILDVSIGLRNLCIARTLAWVETLKPNMGLRPNGCWTIGFITAGQEALSEFPVLRLGISQYLGNGVYLSMPDVAIFALSKSSSQLNKKQKTNRCKRTPKIPKTNSLDATNNSYQNWLVVSNIFLFPPLLGEKIPNFDQYFSNGLVQPPTRSTPVRVRIDREKTRKNQEGGPFEVWKLGGFPGNLERTFLFKAFSGRWAMIFPKPLNGIRIFFFKIQSLTPFKKGMIPRFHSSHRNSFIQPCDLHMDVSKNRGTPKSSILIGFSIINHTF